MTQDHHEPEIPTAPKRPVSRRLFLKGSGATIAATGVAAPAVAQDASPAPPEASPAAGAATPVAASEPPSTTAIEFFNAQEAALVVALTARIFPGTADDPGAREAGVVYYIDRTLSGPNGGYPVKTYQQGPFPVVREDEEPVENTSRTDIYQVVEIGAGDDLSRYGYQSVLNPQDIYRRGLASVDAYARATFNASFVDLAESDQDAVLEAMQSGEATGFDAPSASAFFVKLRNDTIEGAFSDPLYGGNRDMVGWKLIQYPGARGFYTAQEMEDPNFSAEPMSLAGMGDMAGHGH
jgi:gluconate 2-dehydrogenase gamma chain